MRVGSDETAAYQALSKAIALCLSGNDAVGIPAMEAADAGHLTVEVRL